MRLPLHALALIAACVPLAATTAQESVPLPEPTHVFRVPDGLEATVWAATPLLRNPTAMDVDAHGCTWMHVDARERVWVTEAVDYRRWNGRNAGYSHEAQGDRVVILEDTDGGGVADTSKVFVQDPELVSPLGIAVVGDRIFVSNSPDLHTEADYEDYELTLEWRFDPERGAGNSGVLLRLVGEDMVWPRSIEAQLHSGNAGDIWNIEAVDMDVDPGRTQGRRTVRMAPSSVKPLGEWNHYRILIDRGSLRLWINGVLQNEAEWCARVPGKIALQSEGAPIQFRNIRLRPILR